MYRGFPKVLVSPVHRARRHLQCSEADNDCEVPKDLPRRLISTHIEPELKILGTDRPPVDPVVAGSSPLALVFVLSSVSAGVELAQIIAIPYDSWRHSVG